MKTNIFREGVFAIIIAVIILLPQESYGFSLFKKKTELKIWHTEVDSGAKKVLKEICKDFQNSHKDVKIEIEAIPWGDLATKLSIAIASGNPPDIAHIQPFMAASLYEKGLLAPIDEVIQDIGENDIYEVVRDLLLFDGHYYGIAYAMGTTYFAYRADWAREKGLDEPHNWEEYVTFIREIQEGNKNGTILPGGDLFFIDQLFAELLVCNGGRLFDENWRPTFTERSFIEVLRFFQEVSKYAPPGWVNISYQEQFRYFASGLCATVPVAYGRAAKQIEKDVPEEISGPEHFAVMIQPVGPSGTKSFATIDCENWVIFKDSKNIELAKEFLKYFYRPDNYLAFCQTVPLHLIPIRRSLAQAYSKEPFLAKWGSWYNQALSAIADGRVRPIFLVEDDDKFIPFLFEFQKTRIISDAVMDVTTGGKSPEETASRAQKRAEEYIERIGYKKWQ